LTFLATFSMACRMPPPQLPVHVGARVDWPRLAATNGAFGTL
jgi:hypothetical protein